jgi:hypothetical protein
VIEPSPIKKRRRRRSGTAKWHMSRTAVSVKVSDIYKMEAKDCMHYFVKARFGGWKTVRCPGCGTVSSKHCYRHIHNGGKHLCRSQDFFARPSGWCSDVGEQRGGSTGT